MTGTRTKIVCTLGPSSSEPGIIKTMVQRGMNVVRLNLSHGDHEEHRRLVRNVRECSDAAGSLVAIMMDLQGPKLRIGRFKEGSVDLQIGAEFTITSRDVEGNQGIVSTSYANLPHDVAVNDTVLLDDGFISLKAIRKTPTDLVCEVIDGGTLKNNKGINLPGVTLSVSTVTQKDLTDIDFGIEEGVDYIAMSFVRKASDVLLVREYLKEKQAAIPVIAKIEKPEAIDHIDGIIEVSDGVMVARGDLGVEMPAEEVPAIQKMIIRKCNEAGVPVITATQMLDSMVNNPRPTRAEASDVANAILDGTDAVMLSAESAVGKYPLQAVEVMHRIIQATEQTPAHPAVRRVRGGQDGTRVQINEGIAKSACTLSEQVAASAIVSITLSGSMARSIAKYRPGKPIYAISQRVHELRRLCLVWGIEGLWMADLTESIDETVRQVEAMLLELGKLQRGENYVLTAGVPFSERKATNMVRVETVS